MLVSDVALQREKNHSPDKLSLSAISRIDCGWASNSSLKKESQSSFCCDVGSDMQHAPAHVSVSASAAILMSANAYDDSAASTNTR